MAANAVTSPSKPRANRAPNRAQTVNTTTVEPRAHRGGNRAQTVNTTTVEPSAHRANDHEADEKPPTETQILDLLKNPSLRRGRALNLNDSGQPDGFTVDFLPNFAFDHRADPHATRIPCGDTTGIGGLREEIQIRFLPKTGPGYFRMTPRIGGKPTKGHWTEFIDNPPQITTTTVASNDDGEEELEDDELFVAAEAGISSRELRATIENVRLKAELEAIKRYRPEPQPQQQQLRTQQPPPKTLREQLEELRDLKQLFDEERAPQAAPVLTAEVIFAKALVENPGKFGGLAEKFFAKILGDNDENESGGWAKVAARGLELLPEVLPGIAQVFAGMSAAAATAPTMPQTGPNTSTPPVEPANPAIAYAELFNVKLFGLLQRNGPTTEAAAAVRAFLVQFPQYEDAVFNFIEMPVPELMATLAQIPEAVNLVTLPHAAQWLAAFRSELVVDEPENAPQGGAGQAPSP